MSDLVKRLRTDGESWAQPLFNEAADRIEELERQNMNETWVVLWYSQPKETSPRPCSIEGRAWQMFMSEREALRKMNEWKKLYPKTEYYVARLTVSLGFIDDSWLGG